MDKDILKMIQTQDEDFKFSDFTAKEINQIISRSNCSNKCNNKKNKSSVNKSYQKWKQDYFDFYDDVKSSSLKKQDW